MANDDFSTRGIWSVCWDGIPRLRTARANGSDIKAGLFVTKVGETQPDIDLVQSGQIAWGIVFERYDQEIDTAYDDNDENVPVAPISENHGLGVWAYFVASPGIMVEGVPVVTDHSNSTGMLAGAFTITSSTSTNYADTFYHVVGRLAEGVPDDSSSIRLRRIRLGV